MLLSTVTVPQDAKAAAAKICQPALVVGTSQSSPRVVALAQMAQSSRVRSPGGTGLQTLLLSDNVL